MTEPPPSLRLSRDGSTAERDAWSEASMVRAKREALVFAALGLGLNPCWIYVDYALEPQVWRSFLVLRLGTMLALLVIALVLRRTTSLLAVRIGTWCLFATICAEVAWMLPAVDHFWPYVVGYSLIIWGAGALLSWPIRAAWATFAFAPLAVVVAHLLQPIQRSSLEVTASLFYLVSVSIICFVVVLLRERLVGREFHASFRLGVRNDELSSALAQLKQAQARLVASEKLSALGKLLAGLSHEINNPMNVIANNLEPLREYLVTLEQLLDAHRSAVTALPQVGASLSAAYDEADADFVREDFHDAIANVEEATKRILAIHDNLRSFIRGTAPQARHGDINEGLRATIGIMRRGLPRGVELIEDYCDLEPIVGRFDELNQLHFNLLQNAIDAVAGQGVVTVRTRQMDDAIEIAVCDTGPGIAPDALDHVFDPFFTTKEVGEGTGLGLSICHRIVEDHRGTIAVDSSYRQGARLVVTLPTSAREARPGRRIIEPADAPHATAGSCA